MIYPAQAWHVEFLRALEGRECSRHTITAYRCDLEQFRTLCAGRDWSEVTREDVRSYVRMLHHAGRSRTTVNRKLSALRSLYLWLNRNDVHTLNPTRGVHAPKMPRRLPHAVPTASEMQRLFAVAIADLKATRRAGGTGRGGGFYALQRLALLEVAYSTGARVSELVALDVGDLELRRGHLLLKGKGKRERWGYLGTPARRTLTAFLQERTARLQAKRTAMQNAPARAKAVSLRRADQDAPLFLSAELRRFSARGIQLALKQLFAKADLEREVSAHSLRHAFATHLMDAGADIRYVQELLGHASLSTTRIYLRLSMEHIRKVYNAAHPRA